MAHKIIEAFLAGERVVAKCRDTLLCSVTRETANAIDLSRKKKTDYRNKEPNE